MSGTPSAGTLRAATLQLAPTPDRDANLAEVSTLLDTAGRDGVEFLLLPELFSVPFVPPVPGTPEYLVNAEPLDGPSNALIAEKSREYGMTIVSSIFEDSGTPGVYFNTASTYVAGERVLEYRKSHLPLSNNFPEKYYFTPGNESPTVVETHGTKVGTIICYERHFPELARTVAIQGATVLAIPIAAATAYSRSIFEIELRAHAVFNCMYVMSSNRIGQEGTKAYFGGSAIYDPNGATMAQAEDSGANEIVVADLDLDLLAAKRVTERPFLRDRRTELYR
jgi:N-carbamoylputrescine amidase